MLARRGPNVASTVIVGLLASACLTKPNPLWNLGAETAGGSASSDATLSGSGDTTEGGTTNATVMSTSATTDASTSGVTSAGPPDVGAGCGDVWSADLSSLAGFVQEGSDWKADNGVVVHEGCATGVSILRYDDAAWRDGEVMVALRVDDICVEAADPFSGAGVLVRMDDSLACASLTAIFCLLDYEGNTVRIGVAVDGCNGSMYPQSVASPDPALVVGESYSVHVDMQGPDVTCTVSDADGNETQVVLPDASLVGAVGSVGIYAEQAGVTVEAISVCSG